jgi:hypothetical protein
MNQILLELVGVVDENGSENACATAKENSEARGRIEFERTCVGGVAAKSAKCIRGTALAEATASESERRHDGRRCEWWSMGGGCCEINVVEKEKSARHPRPTRRKSVSQNLSEEDVKQGKQNRD